MTFLPRFSASARIVLGSGIAIVGLTTAGVVPAVAQPVSKAPPVAAAHPSQAAAPTKAVVPATVADPSALPASVNISSWDVPVGDQMQVESCIGWVTRDMMGWYANRAGLVHNSFSPMYTFSQVADGWNNSQTTIPDLFNVAQRQGVAEESVYTQGDYNYLSQPTQAERANAAQFKIAGWHDISALNPGPATTNAIKRQLASGQPAAILFRVRAGWDNLTAANNVDTDATSPILPNHVVVVVGYNSTGLILQNSWGTAWGSNGYGVMAWNVVNTDVLEASVMNVNWSAQTGAEWTQNRNAVGIFGNSRPVNATGISKISGAAMHNGSTQFVSIIGSREYWQQRTAAGTYGSLRLIGSHPGVTSVAVASTPNGQLQVTSVIRGQRYFQIRQANGKWTKLVRVGHIAVTAVSAAGTPSGSAIYVLTVRGALYSQTRTASGRWSAMTPLHVSGVSAAAVTVTSNNAQAQLVYNVSSRLYSRTRARSGAWSAPVRVATAAATAISAAGFSNGSAQFVYLSRGNEYVQTRTAAGAWTALSPVGNVRTERAVTATAARTGLVITSAQ